METLYYIKVSYTYTFEDKEVRFKIVGYKASGELDIKLNINKNANILYEIE